MNTLHFTFRVQAKGKGLHSVVAINYDHAANLAAKLLYGAPRAVRRYGLYGFSGYFQGQRVVYRKGRKQRIAVGEAFHLQMMWSVKPVYKSTSHIERTTDNAEDDNAYCRTSS